MRPENSNGPPNGRAAEVVAELGQGQQPKHTATRFGFIEQRHLLARALLDSNLSHHDCAVLAALVMHADRSTAEARPSIPTIGSLARGLSDRSVIRSIQRLQSEGYIESKQLIQVGRSLCNIYRLAKFPAFTMSDLTRCQRRHGDRESSDTVTGGVIDTVTPQSHKQLKSFEQKKSEQKEHATAVADALLCKPVSSKQSADRLTFDQWMDSLTEDELAIKDDHDVVEYSRRIGLPHEILALGWMQFQKLQRGKQKKSSDWPQVFQNHVERGWLDVWHVKQDQTFGLTQTGKQLAIECGKGHLLGEREREPWDYAT